MRRDNDRFKKGRMLVKIAEVKTFLVNTDRQNWLFVKVITEAGLYGWGEASVEGQEKAVEACIHTLAARSVIGEDPLDVEKIWRKMYHHGFWKGGYVHMSAISGIDQAIWDILGKYFKVPTYKLLGGQVRDKVRTYTHAYGKDIGEVAKHYCYDLGFAGVKTGSRQSDPAELDETLNAIRSAIGDKKEIMTDSGGIFGPADAIRRVEVAKKYKLFFFEEPVAPENPEEYKRVRAEAGSTPLAAGERTYSRFDGRLLIENQLIDHYQPDICHCGGITEIRRMAAYAETYHIKFAPHNPNGPVATAASIAVAAATHNFSILEFHSGVYNRSDLYDFDLTARDGYFSLPERPGLGIELDESKFAEYPYIENQYTGQYTEDGSVRDI